VQTAWLQWESLSLFSCRNISCPFRCTDACELKTAYSRPYALASVAFVIRRVLFFVLSLPQKSCTYVLSSQRMLQSYACRF
jgi:hypothetical protein